MPHQEHTQFCTDAGRTKKKSDDFIKKRLDQKTQEKKESILPKHAIKEPELADKTFTLPKIPLKNSKPAVPPIQLSIAEIVEEADSVEQKKHLHEHTDPVIEPGLRTAPSFDTDNVSKAFALFAEKQKVSVISLIKLLIPRLDGNTVIVTLTKQQEEFIGDLKIEWQAFLRNHFEDKSITFQISIDDKANTKRKAYTQAEQFDEMMQENELFRQMVNRLKLKLKP